MTITSRLMTLLLVIGLASDAALADEPAAPLYRDASQPIEKRIDDLLGRMTLEEKVGQMNMPCVYESELGKTIPEKTEAVQKFAAGTLLKKFGPGGGFFTLPNTILHEGPRQQAEFLEPAPDGWLSRQTRLGIPLLETEEGTHGLMCPGANGLPGGSRAGQHLEHGSAGPGLCHRGQGSTCDRRAPDLHARRRADPRSSPRAQRGGVQRRPVPLLADRRDHRPLMLRATILPPPTRSSPGSATIPARASRSAVWSAGPWRSRSARCARSSCLPGRRDHQERGALGVMATYPAIDGVPTHASEKLLTQHPAAGAGLRRPGSVGGRRDRHARLRGTGSDAEGSRGAGPGRGGGRGNLVRVGLHARPARQRAQRGRCP